MSDPTVVVVGAGLAGAEAAWQAARMGVSVRLIEMRPERMTPAHSGAGFAELVCSNSLGALSLSNAGGILKQEMRVLESVVMKAADAASLPAGGALAVDRDEFSALVTRAVRDVPLIQVAIGEVTDLAELSGTIAVVATGPLTSSSLVSSIISATGDNSLYFYDAAAPVLTAESVDESRVFWASRYGNGDADYLNCPMSREEYIAFQEALVSAERAPLREFEEPRFFEGCMPIEQMADRGLDTIRFGPLKPVGLVDPRTGRQPYAVVQLRRDNREGTLLNLVGFQTRLKWADQKRVFTMIPGLEKAEFVRLGVVHRNTYLNAPKVLLPTYESSVRPGLFFAGQLTGVEGYMESVASGLVAGTNAARLALGLEPLVFPQETVIGALAHYITSADPRHFQPMNANIGILPPLDIRIRDKKKRNELLGVRALEAIAKVSKI